MAFLDEDVLRKLARFLPQHDISTIVSMKWGGFKNGALLKLVEQEHFEVFLTGDKNMQNQQQLCRTPIRSAAYVRDQLARGHATYS